MRTFLLALLIAAPLFAQTPAPQPDAKEQAELAIIADPYSRTGWLSLEKWAGENNSRVSAPTLVRPEFKTNNGNLQKDGIPPGDSPDGRGAWRVYVDCRVKHGAASLEQATVAAPGYRHSLAEELECLRATAFDLRTRIVDGVLIQSKLDPSLATLLALDKTGLLDCWIVLNGADAGIQIDYPAFREEHRDALMRYISRYIIHHAPPQ